MRIKLLVTLIVILALLLTAGSTLGISSPNYVLDWFVPLTGAGGEAAASASYTAHFTVGQTATGSSGSASYAAGLGFWYGIGEQIKNIFLPLVLRN